MTDRPQSAKRTHRARQILEVVGRAYPGAWAAADALRAARGAGDMTWPEWCYLPLAGAYAIVSGGGDNRVPFGRSHHTGILGAMLSWRMGQQIIRYDPALYAPMVDTPISGDIPAALLFRLPAWCLYIETPDMTWEGRTLHGAWVHLDADDRGDELRLVLDTAETPELALDPSRGLVPVPLILGGGSIADAISRVVTSGAAQAAAHGMTMAQPPDVLVRETARTIEPLLSLTLYLCSDKPDWGTLQPSNPEPKRTRRDGLRLFAADHPTTWDVGVRLGAALRRAYQAEQTGTSGEHTGPRPHVRRAHWHTILSGPKLRPDGSAIPSGDRHADLRWMPPIPVNVGDLGALPSVVRPVR